MAVTKKVPKVLLRRLSAGARLYTRSHAMLALKGGESDALVASFGRTGVGRVCIDSCFCSTDRDCCPGLPGTNGRQCFFKHCN